MTDEETFTALALYLGNPRPLPKNSPGLTKAPIEIIRPDLDYLQNFVTTCKLLGRELNTGWRLRRFHARWTRWSDEQKARVA